MLPMQDARSLYVVESGSNYHFWNKLTNEVYVIVQPLALPQILKLLEEGKVPVYCLAHKYIISLFFFIYKISLC